MKIPKPPEGLKAPGRKFWNKVLADFVIESEHDLRRLGLGASCLDEIAEGEKVLEIHGRFIEDRYGGLRENPAAKSIRENKIIFCRICRELALDIEGAVESRPPRQY